MAKSFDVLKNKMSPTSRKRAETKTAQLLVEMPLHELRKALKMSQEELAIALGVKQPEVSKLERRADMFISTLRKTIKAMGGDLDIVAHFPGGDVVINQFHDIDDQPAS